MLRSTSWTKNSTTIPGLKRSSAPGISDPREDLLRLAVLLDAHATVARLLVAVARRLEHARREPGVHVDLAGLQAAAHAPRPIEIAREQPRGQAVGGVVRDREGLGLGLERDDRNDGAEDLLPRDSARGCGLGEDRWRDVRALRAHGIRVPLATGAQGRLALADLDVVPHLCRVACGDDRPELRLGIERLADLHRL